jgi:hypothetical protein
VMPVVFAEAEKVLRQRLAKGRTVAWAR